MTDTRTNPNAISTDDALDILDDIAEEYAETYLFAYAEYESLAADLSAEYEM